MRLAEERKESLHMKSVLIRSEFLLYNIKAENKPIVITRLKQTADDV